MKKERLERLREDVRVGCEKQVKKLTARKAKMELKKRGIQYTNGNYRELLIDAMVEEDLG